MDTDKGLISSSSSSTLPTPPPPPYRAKPLPEKLRSKILASQDDYKNYDGVFRYFYYSHLIEPVECIDPDDPSSWDYNLLTSSYFYRPNQDRLVPGEKIDGVPVFELYYIQITKLDPEREFSSIFMKGTNTDHVPMIIYKKPEDEEITLHEPLPLRNIFRPPSALNYVTIALSNPASGGWAFRWGPPLSDPEKYIEYGLHIESFKDELTESEALISYELIKSAAIAELEFTFLDDKERPITILSGSITATNDGDPHTQRIIQQFSPSKPSVLLQSNEAVPVHRSVFGVPLHSRLNLFANLKYFVEKDGPYNIEGGLIFPVPKMTESVEKCIPSPDGITKMRVKVSWWDFIV